MTGLGKLWLVGVALALAATSAAGQEWTRFRGPNGTGISGATTVPVQFSAADYNWRVPLPGAGHSSPVVWGSRVFITSAEEAAGKRHLLCLDAKSGKQLWVRTAEFTPYTRHKLNSFASSTPAVDAERVYAHWPSPDSVLVVAYDHAGNEAWRRDLGKFHGQHGGGSSPVLFEDLLIFRSDNDEGGPEGFIVALDRKTGRTRWQRPALGKNVSYSTPIVYQPAGGAPELILVSNAHGFQSFDPRTGALNWELPGVFKQRTVAGPVVANGLIFATAGNGAGDRQALAIRPGSRQPKAEPKVEYQVTRGVPYVPTPVVLGDRMFLWGDGGIVTCVRAATGEPVWMERVGGNFYGSPICVNGKLYAINTQGHLVVIEAADQFKLLAKIELGEPSHATPAVSGGVLYLRTEGHLISVGGKK